MHHQLQKVDLSDCKKDLAELDIDKLKVVPNNLNNLAIKVDKTDVDKLKIVPFDQEKLSNVVDSNFVRRN